MTKQTQAYTQAVQVLPLDLRLLAERVPEAWKASAEELRLRAGRPMTLVTDRDEYPVPGGTAVTEYDLRTVLEVASQASAHAVLEQVRSGFVTVRGGHRIGLCGTAVVEHGMITNLRALSSLAVRVARQVKGGGAALATRLLEEDRLQNTLILAPPGAGKTTLLRDLIRALSEGEGVKPLRVGVADERGELAALREGMPEFDLGPRTDVMDGCPKAEGLRMLLRGMNPQVLAADEITAPEDTQAILQAAGCGVSLLATAHGVHAGDLSRRPVYQPLLEQKVFQKLVMIRREDDGRRTVKVEDLS